MAQLAADPGEFTAADEADLRNSFECAFVRLGRGAAGKSACGELAAACWVTFGAAPLAGFGKSRLKKKSNQEHGVCLSLPYLTRLWQSMLRKRSESAPAVAMQRLREASKRASHKPIARDLEPGDRFEKTLKIDGVLCRVVWEITVVAAVAAAGGGGAGGPGAWSARVTVSAPGRATETQDGVRAGSGQTAAAARCGFSRGDGPIAAAPSPVEAALAHAVHGAAAVARRAAISAEMAACAAQDSATLARVGARVPATPMAGRDGGADATSRCRPGVQLALVMLPLPF
jgi:hypothetical protein